MFKKFPNIRQHDQADCAAAVLSTISKYYKLELSIMKIREIIGTDAHGTTVQGLVEGAKSLGYEVNPIRITFDALRENFTIPAIAHVVTEEGLAHFVVIYKKKDDELYISDPARGLVKKTYAEFEKIFSGILILMVPTSAFEQMKVKKQSMFDLFKVLMFPQKKLLFLVIVMSFVLSIIGILSSLFSKILFDEIIPYQLRNTLLVYILIFGAISFIQMFLEAFRQHVLLFLSRKVDIPILMGYYKHILNLPMKFFSTRKVGDILARFQDAMTIKDIFTTVSISLAMDILLAIITGIVLFNINMSLFGILIVMVIINIILIYVFKKPYKKINQEQMEAGAQLNSQLIESLKNIRSVKAHGDEGEQIEFLEKRFVHSLEIGYQEGVLKNVQGIVSEGIGTIGNLLFMSVGALAIMNGQLTIGTLIVFQTLSGYFTEPINNLVSLQLTFQEAQIAMNRLREIMEVETEKEMGEDLIQDIDLDGDIVFDNITFKYGSRPPVIRNLTLTIKQGEKLAIVGESGVGKSTLVKLLLRFQDVNEGKITINGYDIKDINHQYVRSKIGYVPQQIELFSGKLIDNIQLGNREATYKEVISASKKAGSHSFIERMPGRYFSYIEEDGGNLSGGERQRLGIARALLSKPDIYIFDEATSNLDTFSEEKVHKTMFKSTKNKTTLIIAHRLSTIIQADKIIVMDQGAIVEIGTHVELIEQNGIYAKLFYRQSGNKDVVITREQSSLEQDNEEEIVYG